MNAIEWPSGETPNGLSDGDPPGRPMSRSRSKSSAAIGRPVVARSASRSHAAVGADGSAKVTLFVAIGGSNAREASRTAIAREARTGRHQRLETVRLMKRPIAE